MMIDRSKPQLNSLLLNEKKKKPITGFYIDENCKKHLYSDFGAEVYDSESVAVVDSITIGYITLSSGDIVEIENEGRNTYGLLIWDIIELTRSIILLVFNFSIYIKNIFFLKKELLATSLQVLIN